MERGFKKKEETPEVFRAKALIKSLDKATDELKENSKDIENILVALSTRDLSEEEKETISSLMEDVLKERRI